MKKTINKKNYNISGATILFVFLFLFQSIITFAQESLCWPLTSAEGLPSNIAYKVVQDNQGLVWIATDNGICTYDGEKVTNIKIEGLNDHFFAYIGKNEYNQIFAVNISGQLVFIENGEAKIIYPFEDQEKIKITELKIHANKLWVRCYFHSNKSLIKVFQTNPSGELKLLKTISKESPHFNILFDNENIAISYYRNKSIKHNLIIFDEKINPINKYNTESVLSSIIKIKTDHYLAVQNDNKTIIYFNRDSLLDIKTVNERINKLSTIDQENYLLSSAGQQKIRIEKNKIILSDRTNETLNIYSVFVCRENLKWVCTANNGVQIIKNENFKFTPLIGKSNQTSSITTIKKMGSTIYCGNMQGDLFIINTDNQEIQTENFEDWITGLLVINKKLIIGTSAKLWSYDFKNKLALRPQVVKSMTLYNEDNVIISTNRGIKLLDNKNKLTYIKNKKIEQRSYASQYDKNGYIWAGTTNGLFIYNHSQDSIVSAFDLLPYNISGIEFSDPKEAYVSTFSHGLFNISNYQTATKISQFPNKITDLSCSENFIAAASDLGAYIYNKSTKKMMLINGKSHLPSSKIDALLIDEPYCYIGTEYGISSFNLNDKIERSEILFNISNVKISGNDALIKQKYTLSHDSNNVNVHYLGISFKGNESIQYKYRILEKDTNWLKSFQNEISFNSLQSGKNTLQIKAFDNSPRESNVQQLEFFVKKVWYKTLLAQIFFFAFFGYCIYYLTRIFLLKRVKDAEDKRQKQRKIDGMKMTALQNHMNPHFISNALYSIQDMIEKDKIWEASEYTSLFADLIRRSMRYATLERISLRQEIDFIKVYLELESMKNQKKIKYELIIDERLDKKARNIFIPPLLIQPIIENSFKHAFTEEIVNPTIKIKFFEIDQRIYCEIEDNGLGITDIKSAIKNVNSTGLSTIRKRLELNSKQINSTSNQESLKISNSGNNTNQPGTNITLTIDYIHGKD